MQSVALFEESMFGMYNEIALNFVLQASCLHIFRHYITSQDAGRMPAAQTGYV